MKRKIIIGLFVQTIVFLVSGAYVAFKTRTVTADVDQVVRLHQVEHLREHYLLRLKAVQSDLTLQDTSRSRDTAVVDSNLASMEGAIARCFGCHHSDESRRQLAALRDDTARYRAAVLRRGESDVAFALGEQLIAQVWEMIDRTNASLERHTLASMSEIATAKYIVYALVVLAPILSGVLGLVWITSLTRPFDALLEATRRLKRGDLDHRIEGLRDEFGELAVSFNDMAQSLKDQLRLMQRTEQLVVVGELAAGLVHEIKNPLAGIKGAVQVLTREADLGAEDRCVLEKVAREVVGLEALLKSFLEFARPARPRPVDADVNAVIESVVAFYLRSHAATPRHPMRITKRLGAVPLTRLDPMQLQQVLLNLLLNAVDSMPDGGGTIEVRTAYDAEGGVVFVEVADTGRGISAEHAAQVFDPFFTTKSGGTGLGLCVSKRLVEQHGGTITFDHNPGGGTVFRVQLPAPVQGALARSA